VGEQAEKERRISVRFRFCRKDEVYAKRLLAGDKFVKLAGEKKAFLKAPFTQEINFEINFEIYVN